MQVLRFLLRSGRGRLGLVIIGSFVFVGIFGASLAPYNPQSFDVQNLLAGISWRHPFGTDQLGRDELSRILTAALPMLKVTALSVGIAALVGTALGVAAGFFGALADSLIMRMVDVMMAFPFLVLAIAIVSFFGPGQRNVTIAIAIALLPGFARVARAASLTVAGQPYVLAARAIGDKSMSIVVRQILPNILPVVVVQISLSCAYAILGESALSFLGLSIQPPAASWGRMLAEGRDFLTTNPHMAVVPGIMITVVVIGFNLIGDGLRDFLDPQLRDQVR